MLKLNMLELFFIDGGGICGTLISSITKGVTFIFELGKSLGSAVRRIVGKNICPV